MRIVCVRGSLPPVTSGELGALRIVVVCRVCINRRSRGRSAQRLAGGQACSGASNEAYLESFQWIVRHAGTARGAVSQRAYSHARFEVAAVFTVVRGRGRIRL